MKALEGRPPWMIRTYAGFGDAEQTNERFRQNLAQGQVGLSIAFDLPTQNGYDSDDPMSEGEVGGTGVAVSHLGDMEILLDGLDLGEINTSMTINATAPWLFALYVALADKQGVPRDKLRGTTQNDLLKEFVGRGTYIYAPEPSLRISTDLIAFAAENAPKWNPTNACGYHYMESGAGPAQEVGFAIGNAMILLDQIRPKISKERFERVVKRISFFVNSGIELVPEIAKMRAYAQLWTEICSEEYGVEDVRFRSGCQVRSLTLTEQQPAVNIIRIAYESLPVTLSASARVRALQLPGFREALGLPDQAEQTLSLRTQQVLMYETGITDYPDIFEGSIVIEGETAKTKKEARAIIEQMRTIGFDRCIHFLSEELTIALVEQQAALEAGDSVRVGVNAFTDPFEVTRPLQYDEDAETRTGGVARQLERLERWRAERDGEAVGRARDALREAARRGVNIVEPSIALAKAGGTTGEWTETLADVFGGRYQAPLGTDVTVERQLSVPTVDVPTRVLLAKAGLDGHVNAVKLLAFACRQAGIEVVYSGLQQTPRSIALTAAQEGVDLIGVSCLSGAHLHLAERIRAELDELGASEIPLIMGGIIPDGDRDKLTEHGVAAVFTPRDSDIGAIIQRIIDLAHGGS